MKQINPIIRQIDTVEYTCLGCSQIFKTQFRRIKPDGNWCASCKIKDINSKRIYISPGCETREKMSKAKIGKMPWSKGKKFSSEHCKKISEGKKGYIPWNKGKHFVSPEERKIRESIHDCCSGMIRRVLKIKNELKVYKTFDYLGYTKTDFVKHIEKQFTDGMSWANYGDWHVDHIIPVSFFVKQNNVDIKTINSLSNLRPLWKIDNLKKGNKII